MSDIDKKSLSEADIRTKFITPAIESAGWDLLTQVREEVPFTAGRIIWKGKTVKRGKRKRADYILYYKPNIPIAVIETKDTSSGSPNDFARHWARIRDHFDRLYDTPQNVRELRQVILQLAVQGKLVEQDPGDEPAARLLARVAEEKERLLKAQLIQKQPSHSAIDPTNMPYPIPSAWKWARFGQVCLQIEAGWSPKCKSRPRNDGEWGGLKISAVTWGNLKQGASGESYASSGLRGHAR